MLPSNSATTSETRPIGAERDRFRGCLLGLAVSDAVGTTVEFRPRDSFAPLTDMVGGGPFGLQPGQWTDDTSMALCLATSLLERGGFDPEDQMNRYCDWSESGYLSSTGECFDIGNTVSAALARYRATGEPFSGSTHRHSAGNGSLMRLAPVPMFFYPDREQALHHSVESSRTTHGALAGAPKREVLFAGGTDAISSQTIVGIARGGYRDKASRDIRGSGYVVDCLEAALWSFHTTDSFAAAILQAANLGGDADTMSAVCGQIAGAYYGEMGIPARWLERLAMRQEIATLADRLREFGDGSTPP